MNWQHLLAFVWLRWRLLVNQWRRAGALNAVLLVILTFTVIATAVPLFIACFALGLYLIPQAAPVYLLYAWDVLIVAFLFFWCVGLAAELQRSDPLSLSKFLHLPVSANGAFLINYLSSLLRLSLIVFVPAMLGFSLALVVAKGILLLPVLPLLAAFLLMVTALTYQVQGWLAALMNNPRRRRTVIVVTTASFILIGQLPNLLNIVRPWRAEGRADPAATWAEELAKLERSRQAGEIDARDYDRLRADFMQKHQIAAQHAGRATAERWEQTARLLNVILPIGWLPLGVMAAAEGHVLPSLLAVLGMTLIGAASLARAYRTTVGMYQGQLTGRRNRPAPAAVPAVAGRARVPKPGGLLLEARLPGFSEPVSAIALLGLRALVRSPEAKMMLLTPIIMCAIFGSMIVRSRNSIPESVRPLVAIGAMGLVLLSMMQLMGNQFGFDRDGFRVFVLCAARRRDILLGKNLTFAPLALGMALILLASVQIVCPMRADHFLAMFPQYLSMYLLFCMCANLQSIYAPVHIAAGSLKASSPDLTTALVQLVMILFLFPLAQGVTLLPLGIEAVLRLLGWPPGAPICLVLSLVECAVLIFMYRVALSLQGDLFQAREQRILQSVTSKAS